VIKLLAQLKRIKEREGIPDFGEVRFSSADFIVVESKIGEDTLNMNFVELKDREITFKRILLCIFLRRILFKQC
jgi:hypothetical protein